MCIKPVVFRMNLYREVALSFKKVGDPWFRECMCILYALALDCYFGLYDVSRDRINLYA